MFSAVREMLRNFVTHVPEIHFIAMKPISDTEYWISSP